MADEVSRLLQVTPRGVITEAWLRADTTAQLTSMHDHMGCSHVEPVRLCDGLTMWCDEEGFLAARPEANLCAIGIAARRGIIAQPLVGTVLFTGKPAEDGTSRERSSRQALELRRECECVIPFTVRVRVAIPRRTPMDEVRAVQQEHTPGAGIGVR